MDQDQRLHMRLPKELHKQARLKSVELGRSLSEIVRQLIRLWVRDEIPTPPKEDDDT